MDIFDDPRVQEFLDSIPKDGEKLPNDPSEYSGFLVMLNGLAEHGPINYENLTLDDYYEIRSLIEVFQNDVLREICDDIFSGKLDRKFTTEICFSFKNRFQVFAEMLGIPSSPINDLITVWRPRLLRGYYEFSSDEKKLLREYDRFFSRIWAVYHEEWDPVMQSMALQQIREKHIADIGESDEMPNSNETGNCDEDSVTLTDAEKEDFKALELWNNGKSWPDVAEEMYSERKFAASVTSRVKRLAKKYNLFIRPGGKGGAPRKN